jgi:hypothetical protein
MKMHGNRPEPPVIVLPRSVHGAPPAGPREVGSTYRDGGGMPNAIKALGCSEHEPMAIREARMRGAFCARQTVPAAPERLGGHVGT